MTRPSVHAARDNPALETAVLEFDAGGHPCSSRFRDVYASREGALAQARHVFLGGNDLPAAWAGRHQFVIVETGFGLGTNFLATWQAWRDDPRRPARLHFVSIEKHPLRRDDMAALARAAPPGTESLRDLRAELARAWPMPLAGLHRVAFAGGAVVLTLALGDAARLVPRLRLGADAFYLDGFSPDRNPEMWSAGLLRGLARLARPGASVATYSCARAVRDGLAACGFALETAVGFGAKREMLRGRFAPRGGPRRQTVPAPFAGARDAVVVGAGLAGCACAHALLQRGWRVRLLERGPSLAAGASALPAGLLQPLLSVDDNLVSRLTRSGFLYTLRLLEGLAPGGADDLPAEVRIWAPCGVLHAAPDAADDRRLRAALAGFPPEFAAYREAAQLATRTGLRPRHGGAWFADGAIVAPARLCAALARAEAFEFLPGTEVRALQADGTGWRLLDAAGRHIDAPIVVLANADNLARLHPCSGASLQSIGGRVSLVESRALAGLRAALSGAGTLVPPLLGPALLGATYEFDATRARQSDAAAHAENRRALQLLAESPPVQLRGLFHGVRSVTADRLPLAGGCTTDRQGASQSPGLYCLAALGSRGLSLAPLLAEHVASLVEGEPAPLEAELGDAVDPARFARRAPR